MAKIGTEKKKLSKKAQAELNKANRKDWGGISPVTRMPANSKAYDRNKMKRNASSLMD